MGSHSTKPPKTLESYTSFDVLPTEYFDRRALQQRYEMQGQQMMQAQSQPHEQLVPPNQYASPDAYMNEYQAPQPQNMYMPIQQQPQPPPRLAFPLTYHQLYESPPLMQEYGRKQPGFEMNFHKPYNQNDYGNYRVDNSFSRRKLGLAPSYSQQIQSVPKFSQSGPLYKF